MPGTCSIRYKCYPKHKWACGVCKVLSLVCREVVNNADKAHGSGKEVTDFLKGPSAKERV